MVKNYKKQIRTIQSIILISIILLFVSVFGGFLNDFVVSKNSGMMPVYYENCFYSYFENNGHNVYSTCQNKEVINYYFLSDIIPFKNSIYSIGDILMLLAIYGNLILLIILVHISMKYRRKKRR